MLNYRNRSAMTSARSSISGCSMSTYLFGMSERASMCSSIFDRRISGASSIPGSFVHVDIKNNSSGSERDGTQTPAKPVNLLTIPNSRNPRLNLTQRGPSGPREASGSSSNSNTPNGSRTPSPNTPTNGASPKGSGSSPSALLGRIPSKTRSKEGDTKDKDKDEEAAEGAPMVLTLNFGNSKMLARRVKSGNATATSGF
eukprot:TRINITY_DN12354_c0_g2_i3.p1 TRINITY_DN12354_c0_g2~~TRINITY_DN12354_c0_g2_i3.p1  ORF type:complete len:199 (-),score=23.27 TRINITY_DN12354_c0_g2_i3:121-717(-)